MSLGAQPGQALAGSVLIGLSADILLLSIGPAAGCSGIASMLIGMAPHDRHATVTLTAAPEKA